MDYEIYEGSHCLGTLSIQTHGLYLSVQGQLSPAKALSRVYGLCKDTYLYLGIVDPHGRVEKQLSAGTRGLPEVCILAHLGPEPNFPPEGKLVGSPLEDLCRELRPDLLHTQNHRDPFLTAEAGDTLPQLEESSCEEEIEELPLTETENGGKENEQTEENYGTAVDPLLLADLPADYDYGQGGEQEADCHHL
ncbi:MAG: hypothetical protein IKT58_01950 [Oscillospiraceae bacterium]|nr:hypothetical protein [Oscillospiraceae bacterium]